MSDVKAMVGTAEGQVIGYFVNPRVEKLCENDYEVSGILVNDEGIPFDRVEFNPEVMPYHIDLSELLMDGLSSLENGYVQRGRQPVCMTALRTRR